VRLTPVAELLLEHAGPLFAQLERLRSEIDAHTAGEVGDIRVAAFPTAIVGIVAPAVADLVKRAPRVRIRVREADMPESIDALTERSADVVVAMESGHAPASDDARFHRRNLARDYLDVVLAGDHPLACKEIVELADLAGETWCAPLEGWSCDHVFEGACRSAGFTPVVEHRTSDWSAIKTLVGAGLGVALVPRLAQPNPPENVVVRPLAGQAPARHLFALCRAGAEHSPAIAAVLDALTVSAARTAEPRLAAA
jgi:DNA-binding transcriptional LysR family regulator